MKVNTLFPSTAIFSSSSFVLWLFMMVPLIECQEIQTRRQHDSLRSSSSSSIPAPQPASEKPLGNKPNNSSNSNNSNNNNRAATCMSLKGTRTCPEFGDYSVHTDPQLFNNLSEFDSYIEKSMANSSVYQAFFRKAYNCPKWDGKGLRYPISLLCGLIVDISTARNGCNANQSVKQICASTANASITSYNSIFSDRNICPQDGNRTLPQDYLIFASNKRLTKNDPEKDCLLGLSSETVTCGFATLDEAKSYCDKTDSSKESCCQTVGKSSNAPISPTQSMPVIEGAAKSNSSDSASSDEVKEGHKTAKEAESKKAESNEQRGNVSKHLQPMVIVAIVVSGVVLIAVAGGIIYFARRQKREDKDKGSLHDLDDHTHSVIAPNNITPPIVTSPIPAPEGQPQETLEVIYEYTPNLFDEIQLCIGDKVLVKHRFDDGWAFGYNVVTGQEGSFPLACVAVEGTAAPPPLPSTNLDEMNASVDDITGRYASISRTSMGQYSQRASSLYVPQ